MFVEKVLDGQNAAMQPAVVKAAQREKASFGGSPMFSFPSPSPASRLDQIQGFLFLRTFAASILRPQNWLARPARWLSVGICALMLHGLPCLLGAAPVLTSFVGGTIVPEAAVANINCQVEPVFFGFNTTADIFTAETYWIPKRMVPNLPSRTDIFGVKWYSLPDFDVNLKYLAQMQPGSAALVEGETEVTAFTLEQVAVKPGLMILSYLFSLQSIKPNVSVSSNVFLYQFGKTFRLMVFIDGNRVQQAPAGITARVGDTSAVGQFETVEDIAGLTFVGNRSLVFPFISQNLFTTYATRIESYGSTFALDGWVPTLPPSYRTNAFLPLNWNKINEAFSDAALLSDQSYAWCFNPNDCWAPSGLVGDGTVRVYDRFSPFPLKEYVEWAIDGSFQPLPYLDLESLSQAYLDASALTVPVRLNFWGLIQPPAPVLELPGTVLFLQPTNRLEFVVGEDAGFVNLKIARTNGTLGGVSVLLKTVGVTAMPGQDFVGINQRIEFGPGEAIKTVRVNILPDGVAEGDEVFQVTLSDPLGGANIGNPAVTQIRITNRSASNSPPQVIGQPMSQTVAAGTSVQFAVSIAGGVSTTFQWRLNGTSLLRETNSVLLLPNVTSTNGGQYSVLVRNAFGNTISSEALLTVIPPPPFQVRASLSVTGSVQLTWNTVTGQIYRVQFTDRLTQATWTNLGDSILASDATASVSDIVGIHAQRYYRIVRAPATSVVSAVETVLAWGWNDYGQTTVPAGLSAVMTISAGYAHTVALMSNSTVVAWGDNSFDQTTVPISLIPVKAIAAGRYHTVLLTSNRTVIAWGNNESGQTTVPAGLHGVTAIAAGDFHTVALKSDGTVEAWGENLDGQSRVDDLHGIRAIAAGAFHTVALRSNGTVMALGYNSDGQTTVPAGLSGVTAIAAGYSHTVALKSDGTVVAWGQIDFGQTAVPAGLSGVIAIAAGEIHTVALKSDGTVVAWGSNSHGQTTVPAGLHGVTAIAAGAYHTVVLK